jgi:hypothetical protein
MKHLSRLALLTIALVPTAALAQIQTYYHAGAWDAFSGRTDSGGAVCGIGTTAAPDNRRLAMHFDIGGTDTVFSASKPDWSIPANTHVTVVMQIGLNWARPRHYLDIGPERHPGLRPSVPWCLLDDPDLPERE